MNLSSPSEELRLGDFVAQAGDWLDQNAARQPPLTEDQWGVGSDEIGIYRSRTNEEESRHLEKLRQWNRRRFDAGFGAISWPEEFGGAGLPREFEEAYGALESDYVTPDGSESVGIGRELVCPTILAMGTADQKKQYVQALRRTDILSCQLFSEPEAGSDLSSMTTRAERAPGGWIVNGQKVWTSGAQFADLGYLICRTDPSANRREALSAFLLPMDSAGVEVRELKQMTGGAAFNEVFLSDVFIPENAMLGPAGAGYGAMLTTLGFERLAISSGGFDGPDFFARFVAMARHLTPEGNGQLRQLVANIYGRGRVNSWTLQRAQAGAKNGVPGPAGSIGKLAWSEGLREVADAAAQLLGARLLADDGSWGTFAWNEFICGVPGIRIAGGTDEIQRNTIAERVLGLPREPHQ